MINPNLILEAFVDKLRTIPELVELLDKDPEKIIAYYDSYPDTNSLREAIVRMPRPGVLVAWEGDSTGRRGLCTYTFRVVIRAPSQFLGPDGGAGSIRVLITHGIPDGESEPIGYLDVHPDCFPMMENDNGVVPGSKRNTWVIDDLGNTIDFFEMAINFSERRDLPL